MQPIPCYGETIARRTKSFSSPINSLGSLSPFSSTALLLVFLLIRMHTIPRSSCGGFYCVLAACTVVATMELSHNIENYVKSLGLFDCMSENPKDYFVNEILGYPESIFYFLNIPSHASLFKSSRH